ncbi:proteasome activator complex subunit 4A isoform X2 [Nomia melanderi]|nr:proteasome activator complex subunit 4A-like isoform X2 [Nomia melanderi]XP_031825587.1 proteasome activator complex subunit 4A-like isoform X2 [Nomia melanderi]XP_031825588.1 proteasome activator complex subunit 4A-like isoform X2 [Nomia melanderi]XP_031825590.1 proteasome activator complex subunit 4A-like isoform X2 [Nomia melanderi]
MDSTNEGVKIRYQKELIYNKLLPYVDELESDSQALLAEIKGNLGRAIMLRELQPGCVLWVIRLHEYIKIYGLKFSKEDHILLIKLMYELVTIPDLEPYLMNGCCLTLISLLKKKSLIPPEELELPWKPLYKLACHVQSTVQTSLGMYRYSAGLTVTLNILIHAVKVYFPLSATQEILDELRPMLCPLDLAPMSMNMEKLESFLPVQLPPKYHSIGHELWFDEFMSLWEVCNNAPKWENEIMNLMATLASENIGYINWEPHIPLMFTRFVRCFGLPVLYNKQQACNYHEIDTSPIAIWIVSVLGHGSTAQMYFEKFLKTIDTYFHPANTGQWLRKLKELLMKLSYHFITRLRKERYPKPTWETPVPDEYKLTDDDIDAFVKSMMPVAMTATFCKTGFSNSSQILQHLATMRPSLVIPDVLNKISSVLDSLTTESYKLYTSLSYMEAIAGPMVEGSRNVNKGYTYPEGPAHVLPLLFLLLPGINPSDTQKCFVIFRLISFYASFIPVMEPSEVPAIMDEEEEALIYEATSKFEDFIIQFFDRVFYFIDSTSLESVRLESSADNGRSKMERVTESVLKEVCTVLLIQTNDKIFECALHKLRTFVTERILETKVAGQLAALLCRLFARVNGRETLRSLLPLLSETILKITGENTDIVKEENLDNRLLYAMLLLSAIVDTPGKYLLPHIDVLITVLDRVLILKSREGNNLAVMLLKSILYSLSQVIPYRFKSTEVLHWGQRLGINTIKVEWYIPGKEEITALKRIFFKYLLPEITKLQKYCEDWNTLSRDELLTSLNIVCGIVQGCESVLPIWEEEPLILIKSSLKSVPFKPTLGAREVITMPDGSNVRRCIATLMNNFQKVILMHVEDDTKSLQVLVEIWINLLLGESYTDTCEIKHRHFKVVNKIFKDKLVGNKGLLKPFVLQRANIQHETRIRSQNFNLTETHKEIMLQLFTLSTSRYPDVRSQAQCHLFLALQHFHYSYVFIVPRLLDILKMDPEEHHNAYKSALYILFGPSPDPIIMKCDWKLLRSLWPALVLSKTSEKLSVVRLRESLVQTVNKRFPTVAISLEVPETCLTVASKLWTTQPRPNLPLPTENEIKQGLEDFKEIERTNLTSYNELVNELLNILLEKNLYWRHRLMAMSFIRNLVHPHQNYPPKVVRYFLEALIHDSVQERQIAISVVVYILKQLKRKHPKVLIDPPALPEENESRNQFKKLIPGQRPDNAWLQYNYETRPLTAEQWDEPRFVHNVYTGYYTWPAKIEIYAPSSEQPCLDPAVRTLTEHEKEIDYFFNDPQNIEKLIRYFSLEDKREKFNCLKFLLFKGVFRNHGIVYLKHFLPHLYKLIADKQKSSQKYAAEIIAGIIRGSKHWPFDMICEMWDCLLPVVRLVLTNLTVESHMDWGLCFATAQRHRDPNRHHWLLECLMEEPHLGESESSFVECGRLLILQAALEKQSWRVSQLLERLLKRTEDRLMASPFQNVRGRLGSVLVTVFNASLRFPDASDNQWTHKVEDLINRILPKLQSLVTETDLLYSKEDQSLSAQVANVNFNDSSTDSEKNAEDREIAIRLFKTVCKWISITVVRSPIGVQPGFYKVFPVICQLENCDSDEELAKLCTYTLALLAQALTLPRDMPTVLEEVIKMSKHTSWWARSTCLQFLQVLIFHNMSTFLSNSDWVNHVKDTVLHLLEDERVEVRKNAGQCLSGLLHCAFITDQEKLLEEFKKKARTKSYRRERSNQSKKTTGKELTADTIRIRHAAVLGLCAFIQAHPYDIPKYVPSIFEFLSPYMNDLQPISTTIRKTLDDFKRTHYDGWRGINGYAQDFTEEQLTVLQDLTMPPPHYV